MNKPTIVDLIRAVCDKGKIALATVDPPKENYAHFENIFMNVNVYVAVQPPMYELCSDRPGYAINDFFEQNFVIPLEEEYAAYYTDNAYTNWRKEVSQEWRRHCVTLSLPKIYLEEVIGEEERKITHQRVRIRRTILPVYEQAFQPDLIPREETIQDQEEQRTYPIKQRFLITLYPSIQLARAVAKRERCITHQIFEQDETIWNPAGGPIRIREYNEFMKRVQTK